MKIDRKAILKLIKNQHISAEEGLYIIESLQKLKSLDQEKPTVQGLNAEKEPVVGFNRNTGSDVAVIGMSGQFADSRNIQEFWQNLLSGKNCVQEISETRGHTGINGMEWNKKDPMYAGLIPHIDEFDPRFFNILPSDAGIMDPQQRLFLQESWKALEDAGYTSETMEEHKCGIFVGCSEGDYVNLFNKTDAKAHFLMGNSSSILAARLSYFLNLKGPSISVDTACSSSLVAIHLACESIRNGTSDMALAGGVFVMSTPLTHIALNKMGMLSPTGECKAFDNNADGFVLGEGVGVVLLKPVDRALRDKDFIYGVIKGSEINQDGKTNGMTAPSAVSQTSLEKEVYQKYKISPQTIGYIEAHGTGTKLGDPIEIAALTDAFAEYALDKQTCPIGSVKTNIGHSLNAAGVAGIIKILLCMKHRKLVPSLHYRNNNEHAGIENSPFYINTELKSWQPDGQTPLRAAISSFGFSGTNCHMILEEAPRSNEITKTQPCRSYLITISAKTKPALKQKIYDLIEFIDFHADNMTIDALAYGLHIKKDHWKFRSAVVVDSFEDLQRQLAQIIDNKHEKAIFKTEKENTSVLLSVDNGNQLLSKLEDYQSISNDKYRAILHELKAFYLKGVPLNWKKLYNNQNYSWFPLPVYPFAKEKYWGITDVTRTKSERFSNFPAEKHPAVSGNIYAYTHTWENTEKPELKKHDFTESKPVLVFCNSNEVLTSIRQHFIEGPKIIQVIQTPSFIKINDDTFGVDPRQTVDYLNFFRALKEIPETVVHLWEFGKSTDISVQPMESIFHIIKACSKVNITGFKRFIRINYVDDEKTQAVFNATAGYSRSLSQIFPRLSFSTIGLESQTADKLAGILAAELTTMRSEETEIFYRQKQRYVKKYTHVRLEKNISHTLLKQKGTYLITGAFGGLGKIFASYLARFYNANLILVGRSEINDDKRRFVKDLEASGGNVLTFQANVCDREKMMHVIQSARETYGGLNGVIHSAGITDDKMVTEKNWQDAEAVLKPKIQGTEVLDEVTHKEDLDFFVLFSSTASILGDFGQCHYAIANRFLDEFAQYREKLVTKGLRKGISVSINWPLWKDGGMNFNQDGNSDKGDNVYLKTSHMSYLETDIGIDCFQRILARPFSQIMLISGDQTRIQRALSMKTTRRQPAHNITGKIESKKMDHMGNEETLRKTINILKQIISNISKIEVVDLEDQAEIEEIGFDSINLKELSFLIREYYQVDFSPAVFFECNTIQAIAQHLIEEYPQQIYQSDFDKAHKNNEPTVEPSPPELNSTASSEQMSNKTPTLTPTDIAIVGMAGVFPQSKNLEAFWENLKAGNDLITKIPRERWDWKDYLEEYEAAKDGNNLDWGGFIPGVEYFDAGFFNISPREAKMMDPQQRMFLQTAWQTFENAGIKVSDFSEQAVGVFVGAQFNDYEKLLEHITDSQAQIGTGNSLSMLANRVSYLFDFRGPSETIDTACSSSLVAVNRAVKSLQFGECSLAVAGGVSLMLTPHSMLSAAHLGVLSRDGRCKTLDAKADGYVKGEGIGAVLLKPLDQAVQDGNPIYAVIKGSAVNHGGKANSLTAPNPDAQASLLNRVYRDAGLDPGTISYIEMHGTGTELGDPVEVEGIKKSFKKLVEKYPHSENRKNYCGLGSLKTNMGHLEPASGIAGLIKIAMSLKHRVLPASLHLKNINPFINVQDSPFYAVQTTRDWKRLMDEQNNPIPLRAGVSSFGFGGTNAHVVLEEFQVPASQVPQSSQQLIVLSAKNETRLIDYAERMVLFLEKHTVSPNINEDSSPKSLQPQKNSICLDNLAYTLQTGREEFEERLAVIVSNVDELKEQLTFYYQKNPNFSGLKGKVSSKENAKSLLLDSQAGETFIAEMVKEKALNKLAQLWIMGIRINWSLLHNNSHGHYLSLPTYPFEKKRYWVDLDTTPRPEIKPVKVLSQGKQEAQPLPEKEEIANTIPFPLNSTSPDTMEIREQVCEILATVLHINKSELDPQRSFQELGVDSILGLEFIKDINKIFKTDLKSTALYDHVSIEELSAYLSSFGTSTESRPSKTKPFMQKKLRPCRDLKTDLPTSPQPHSVSMEAVQIQLLNMLAETLYLSPDEIDLNETFNDLGVDSIMGLEYVKNINKQFQMKLKGTHLYDYPTVPLLAEYVSKFLLKTAVTVEAPVTKSVQEFEKEYLQPVPAAKPGESEKLSSAKMIKSLKLKVAMDKQFPVYDFHGKKNMALRLKNKLPAKRQEILPDSDTNNPKEVTADQSAGVPQQSASKTNVEKSETTDIAIIGISGRFPGAGDINQFWLNLKEGVDSVTEVPSDRWHADEYFSEDPGIPGKTYSKWGGWLDDIDRFDPIFFNITPMEAKLMDPQQRIFLEESWKALEDAGYSPKSMNGRKCGVYVGVMNSDYNTLLFDRRENSNPAQQMVGNSNAILASRISYLLNLKGPAFSIDTACSSSLLAIHLACKSLQYGDMEMMLAGGITLYITEKPYIGMSKAGMLSPDGKCKAFDNSADGIVPGEGVGVLVLKRLDTAVRDRDHIYGVIKGSGCNQDGKTNGINSPSLKSQKELELEVYRKFKINPETITYFEAHGTGTKLGDPIEIGALAESFAEFTDKKQYCALASLKSNVGHTSAAAGVVGMIKILLAMKHAQIPPTLHFSKENEHIDFDNSPFYVNTSLKEWNPGQNGIKRAAINSFGFSGTNCHMVVDQYVAPSQPKVKEMPCYPILLSAKTPNALNKKINQLIQWIASEQPRFLGDLSYVLATGREHFKERFSFVVKDVSELMSHLKNTQKNGFERKKTGKNSTDILKTAKTVAEILENTSISDQEYQNRVQSLTDLYMKGANIDWEEFFSRGEYYRISLPGYPFENERCWINEQSGKAPLLNWQNKSTLKSCRFSTLLKKTNPMLSHHLVKNQIMLPGAAHIELAKAAAAQAGEANINCVSDISWDLPITVEGDSQEIQVTLESKENRINYFISNSNGTVFSHGTLSSEWDGENDTKPQRLDVPDILDRCTKNLSMDECYQQFSQAGINYGPMYRLMQSVRHNSVESISTLNFTETVPQNEKDVPHIQSFFLDAAFQSSIGLMKLNETRQQDVMYLPCFLESIKMYHAVKGPCYAYVQEAKGQPDKSVIKRFNIHILDTEGQILVTVENFTIRKITNMGKQENRDFGKFLEDTSNRSQNQQSEQELLDLLIQMKKGKFTVTEVNEMISS